MLFRLANFIQVLAFLFALAATAAVAEPTPASATGTPAPSPSPSGKPGATATIAPINTNRPTQGTNTGVVGPGVYQIENGFNATLFKGKGTPALYQMNTQFRAGLGNTTEISVQNPWYNWQGASHGAGDTMVELKWQFSSIKLGNGNDAVLAVIPNIIIPTGATAFRNPGPVGQIIMSADLPVGKNGQDWTINLAPSTVADPITGRRFVQVFAAAYYTYNITPTIQHFVEVSGYGPDRASGGAFLPSIDTGLEFLAGVDNQFDITVLKGLGTRGTDYLFTIGYSHRFR